MGIQKGKGQVIGDYIHLKYENYLKYGTNYKTQSGKQSPQEAFKQHKKELRSHYSTKKTVTDMEIEHIKLYYNMLFSLDQGALLGLSNEDVQSLKNDVISSLNVMLNKGLSADQFAISAEKLNVQKNFIGEGSAKDWGQSTSVERIEKTLQQVLTYRDEICKSNNPVYSKIKTDFDKLDVAIQALIKAEHAIIQEGQEWKSGSVKLQSNFFKMDKKGKTPSGGIYSYVSLSEKNDQKNLVAELVKILAVLNYELIGTSLARQMGLVGENFLPVLQESLRKYAIQHTDKLANELVQNFINASIKVVGDKKTKNVVKSSNILGADSKYQPFDYVQTIGNTKFEANNPTDDKVDIVISFDSNKSINASIKNYNPNSVENYGVHLLKGANLLVYLQNYINFTNHYLNITATHEEENDSQPTAAILQQTHAALRLTLATLALAGGVWTQGTDGALKQQDKVQLFIINKQAGGKANFEIYRVDDLLKKIESNIGLVQFGKQTPINQVWKNTKIGESPNYENAYLRCIRILGQLKSYKIDVSLSKDIFNS